MIDLNIIGFYMVAARKAHAAFASRQRSEAFQAPPDDRTR